MSKHWPLIKLGDVLRRSDETVALQPDSTYREVTVKMWGKGVILRGVIIGAEIASSRRFVARTGQFILSRIDARNGAIGIVPPELDGAVVTNDFPLFTPNPGRIDSAFLGWLGRTRGFVELCVRASEGTTNRVRLQEDRFLALEVPLPPLAEQRRVVAQIEELATQIHEARSLRKQAEEDGSALLVAMAHRGDMDAATKIRAGWRQQSLSDLIRFVDDSHKVDVSASYPNLGIYSFGRGLFHKPPIAGISTSATALRRVKAGQFIYSRLFAFEGAYGIVTSEFDGNFVSNEYPTFECDSNRIRAEFLAAYFRPAHIWKAAAVGSKGLGDRRQRVQPSQILALEIWVPPIDEQNHLAAVQVEVAALKRLQAATVVQLDAMLPAILDHAFRGELALSELTERAKTVVTVDTPSRPIISAEDYFVQLIPALLEAVGGRLELDKLNAAVALLFLPKVLRPLIDSIGGADAQAHFARFNQPLKDSVFVPMLRVLMKTGAITCDANDQVTSLQLHQSAAPPIEPVVSKDARFLAAIVNLVPASPVQATVRKLCPKPAKVALLGMS